MCSSYCGHLSLVKGEMDGGRIKTKCIQGNRQLFWVCAWRENEKGLDLPDQEHVFKSGFCSYEC